MRITGGRARGIPLTTGRALDLRPATDRMREAVFSSLGSSVEGTRVLDLFAGTGAYGFEAWSRGAVRVVAVERDAKAVAAWRENLTGVARSLGADPAAARVHSADIHSWRPDEGFDLIFADPPYAEMSRLLPRVAVLADACLEISEDARLLIELPGEFEPLIPGFRLVRRLGKGRGQPTVAIFARGVG